MSQHTQHDEIQHGYQASTPEPEHTYTSGYTNLNSQQDSSSQFTSPHFTRRDSRLRTTDTPAPWQHLVVAIVSLFVLIALVYILLSYSKYDYYVDPSSRLIALAIVSITIILINFLFKKR